MIDPDRNDEQIHQPCVCILDDFNGRGILEQHHPNCIELEDRFKFMIL
jgi:hypothetical protein